MKLQLALVAALAQADPARTKADMNEENGPKKGIMNGESKPKNTGPPMVHCSQQSGPEDYYYNYYYYYYGNYQSYSVDYFNTDVASTSPNHGQFGSFGFSNYMNDLYCYIDFANECDGQGVDIEITKMAVESSSWNEFNGQWIKQYGCNYDAVKFMYTDANGNTQYTAEDCGSFNTNSWANPYYDLPKKDVSQTKFSLVGTDFKMVLETDHSIAHGMADFNWQCRSYGNEICPSKYDGSADSGCYVQSSGWQPGKEVSCSMDNAACLTTTCSAEGISSFFRGDLFHVNSKHEGTFMEQLQQKIRKLRRTDTGAVLVENDPCGYTVNGAGVEINWNYEDCGVAPSMKNGKIAYGVSIQALGNDADENNTIEFYVDLDARAECLYDPEIDVEASFFVNQEDVDAETEKYASLIKNFKCLFFEDEQAKNQIKEHNIVNMGERIYGRVRSKKAYGLMYKLQRVTFTDASGKIVPPPKFHVVGGGTGGGGNNIVSAAVQRSTTIPNKPLWRPVGKNMKFNFLSFGFENLSEQNEVDIKCKIKISIDPTKFPEAALGGEGTRTLMGGLEPEYDYSDTSEYGSFDYYDEDY